MGLCRRIVGLSTLLGFELVTIIVLHRLGATSSGTVEWSDLGSWLATSPPEAVLVASVRLTALALAWWLLLSTLLYLLARAGHVPVLLRSVRWVTFPPIRRLIDGFLATSILASSTLAGAGVASAAVPVGDAVVIELPEPGPPEETTEPAYRPRPADDGIPTAQPSYLPEQAGDNTATTTRPPYVPEPAGDDAVSDVGAPRSGTGTSVQLGGDVRPAVPAPSKATADQAYVVQRGDHLWRIAERHVAAETGRPLDQLGSDEVATYWRRLIDVNVEHLRSGDADLLHPGEKVRLPPLFDQW